MDIERVQLNVSLKAGGKVWLKGQIFSAPLPPFITAEVRANTGTVRILERKKSEPIQKEEEKVVVENETIFVYRFTNDEKELVVERDSIEDFCKEYSMKPHIFKRVLNGGVSQYKGWTVEELAFKA